MKVCEIFYSLQGESSFAGLPCAFIRLSGCNLECCYCDTTYAKTEGSERTVSQILQEIALFKCKLVEVTGGEPLLQEEVIELLERLHEAGYTVLLETNGTVFITKVPSWVHVIIDVKLPGSGHPGSFMQENLQWLREDWDELKFVVSGKEDFSSALDFITEHKLGKHRLLFSPVWGKVNPAELADWIKSTGLPLRLNLQLHKLIWDSDRRGV